MNELREAKELHQDIEYIKLKYPLLFDRLCEKYDPHAVTMPLRDKRVVDLFEWDKTSEGRDFWVHVDDREFMAAKQMHPEYFEGSNVQSDNKPIEQTAGLTEIEAYFRSLPVKAQIQVMAYFKDILRAGWEEKRKELETTIDEAKDYKNLIDSGLNSFR